MAVARFYQLAADPPETLLPVLITKAQEIGLTVALRGTDRQRMADLDLALWQGEGFLPHGLAGGPHDALQPCLLTWEPTPTGDLPNRPGCLIALDGAEVGSTEARDLQRLCVVFDSDEAALEQARAQWRALTGAGIEAEYWSREGGRWACKARHPR